MEANLEKNCVKITLKEFREIYTKAVKYDLIIKLYNEDEDNVNLFLSTLE